MMEDLETMLRMMQLDTEMQAKEIRELRDQINGLIVGYEAIIAGLLEEIDHLRQR